VTFGTIVENALLERERIGDEKKSESRQMYTLEMLLDPEFKLPRPKTRLERVREGAMNLMMMGNKPHSGVKVWRELPPEQTGPEGE
jgi:hypothetical protein